MRLRSVAVLAAAGVILAAGSAGMAATYTMTGGGTWGTSSNWTPTGVPTTGDTAILNDTDGGWNYCDLGSTTRYVGNLQFYTTGRWYLRYYSGTSNLRMDQTGTADAEINMRRGTTYMQSNLGLWDSLVVHNSSASYGSTLRLEGIVSGGTLADPRNITVRSDVSQSLQVVAVNSGNTNVGTWTVDGSYASLIVTADGAFGDAANEVVLRNGGTLRLSGIGLGRTIRGSGTVWSYSGTLDALTVGSGSVLAPGESVGTLNIDAASMTLEAGSELEMELYDGSSDLISTNCDVALGGTLTLLPQYSPLVGTDWTLMSTSGGTTISGAFANSLPVNYSYSVVDNMTTGGQDLVVSYVPEPASMGLLLLGGCGLLLNRRRNA